MNKSLVGLLVFGLFGLSVDFKNVKQWKDGFFAAITSLMVFLPWDIFTKYKYPLEAKHESITRFKHITHAIEGHDEKWWYYFEKIGDQYSFLSFFILACGGMLIVALTGGLQKNISRSLFIVGAIVMTFYTIAQTKMPVFTFILAPIVFFFMAVALDFIGNKLNRKLILLPVLAFFMVWGFQPEKIKKSFAANDFRKKRADLTAFYKTQKWDDKTLVINLPALEHIPAMFFTNCVAYPWQPKKEDLLKALNNGYRIINFKSFENGNAVIQQVDADWVNTQ